MNARWHKAHPMPARPTLDQRLRWHAAHATVCHCREMPAGIAAELARRRKIRASRARRPSRTIRGE